MDSSDVFLLVFFIEGSSDFTVPAFMFELLLQQGHVCVCRLQLKVLLKIVVLSVFHIEFFMHTTAVHSNPAACGKKQRQSAGLTQDHYNFYHGSCCTS